MDNVYVTSHARKRMHKRMGIGKKSSERVAHLALIRGLATEETKGTLRRFVCHTYRKYGTANNIRIFSEKVFVFQDKKLITVYSLPNELRQMACFCKRHSKDT